MTPVSILVAEDEADLRDLIKAVLQKAGYLLLLTANGMEARAALAKWSFDIVLTDLIMPGCDGLALIGEVSKKYPRIKIVAMSGGGFVPTDQYLQIAKSAGAHVVLPKPFTRETLLRAIAEVRP